MIGDVSPQWTRSKNTFKLPIRQALKQKMYTHSVLMRDGHP